MSVQQSDITDLNYDLVLGVSQTGMNGIIKNYYQNSAEYFWPQTWYFINSVPVNQNEAWQALGNQDPFEIASWNGQGAMPANIQSCINGGFTCAFQFTPGDPGDPNANPPTFPATDYTYITYEPNLSRFGPPVFNYSLCCSNIQVVYWDPYANVWVNYTQPTATGSPMSSIVKFCAYATIGSQKAAYNASDNTIPADVKAQAAAFAAQGVSFQIEQIIFLLDNLESSPLTTLPFMPTLNETYYQRLAPCFQYAYAQALKTSFKNQPAFCYALPQTNQPDQTVLNPTNVQLTMQQLVDASGNVISSPTPPQLILDSFNYTCSLNGTTPVPAQQFKWNWFDTTADIIGNSSYNGAIALSKFALGNIFFNQLKQYVQNNCWVPQIQCVNNNGQDLWTFGMTGSGPLDIDPVIKSNSNNYFLIYTYNPAPFTTHGQNNPNDFVTINTSFQLQVYIKDSKTITVIQESRFMYTISLNGGEAMTGIPLDTVYTEDYAVSVTGDGKLVFQAGTPQIDNQGDQGIIPCLTDAEAKQFQQAITGTESSIQSSNLTAEPLGTSQQVIFPGGNTFTFYDVQFTASNDLACKVNYLKTSA